MRRGLLEGKKGAEELAELAQGKLREKRPQLVAALEGHLLDSHRFLLKQMLEDLEHTEEAIREVERKLEEYTAPFADILRRLDTIPGVNRTSAYSLLAELGDNMDPFPTVSHAASWAGVCPGNHQTGGKRLKGTTRAGNRWLRRGLCEAAWAARNKKGSYFAAQYRCLAARRGHKRALTAVAHSLLTVVYHLIREKNQYREPGEDFFYLREQERLTQCAVKRLEKLGYSVSLQPAA